MGNLNGKVCIVTGAAGGIGKAIGVRLAEEGASVVFGDIDAQRAEKVAAELRDSGRQAIAAQVDVSSRSSVRALIHAAVSEFGQLDVMFNNAGIIRNEPFLEATEQNWEDTMRVNVLGVMLGTIEAAKQMIAQGTGGKIINTSSVAGRSASHPLSASYAASKAAVIAFSQAAAKALAQHSISVNAIAPGIVATPMFEQIDRDCIDLGVTSQPGQATRDFGAVSLLGRPLAPEEIAGLCAFLASSDADAIIGQVINVCGGMIF